MGLLERVTILIEMRVDRRLSDEMVAGGISGAVVRTIIAPLDVLKIRFQIQFGTEGKYMHIIQSLQTVVREEGFIALWKGNLSATYLWVSYSMVQFGSYEFFHRWIENFYLMGRGLQNRDENVNKHVSKNDLRRTLHVQNFCAGACAGLAATAITYPFDIMRTHFAIQGRVKLISSISDFIRVTWRKQGALGFYRGFPPTAAGVAPCMGLNFAIYEASMNLLRRNTNTKQHAEDRECSNLLRNEVGDENGDISSTRAHHALLAGGCAGIVSKLLVYPLDTIKKRMQLQALRAEVVLPEQLHVSNMPQYRTMIHCASEMVRTEGWGALYKGLWPTVLKSFSSTALTFAVYTKCMEMLIGR